MISFARMIKAGICTLLLLAAVLPSSPALADAGFPFGAEMTLDVDRQPGSKRIPNLEIGDNGEVILELWCKGGMGQFSVAGNTVDLRSRSHGEPSLSAGSRAAGR